MVPVIVGDELFYDTDLADCFGACSNHEQCTVFAFDNENNTCQIYWELQFRVTAYAALRPRDGFFHPHQEHMIDTFSCIFYFI